MRGRISGIGSLLVVIGIIGVLRSCLDFSFLDHMNLWPIFILIPGICFNLSYFTAKENPGLLVPGGILIVLGLLFLFESFTKWQYHNSTWPIYIFALAYGLFQLYAFTPRHNKRLLISILILLLAAAISFIQIFTGVLFQIFFKFPLLLSIDLIILGLMILMINFFVSRH